MKRRSSDTADISKYIITHDQLKFDKVIGTGGFGEVHIGIFIPTGLKVAIKKLYASDETPRTKELYQREVEVLAYAKNRFLLQFIGFTNSPPYCIVTKYIANGSLYSMLHTKKTLDAAEKTLIAYGISAGMQFLHDREIIHRDLKTQNVLLDDNNVPVICDFGSSRIEVEGAMTSSFGTPNYMAPEFIQGEEYTLSADVYSFGLILWEMLTGEVPFAGLESAQVIYNVVIQQQRPIIPENTPIYLQKLIESCWAHNPHERPTFSQIIPLFEDGTIEFPGCDQEKYQTLLKQVAPQLKIRRRHSDPSLLSSNDEAFNNIPLSREDRNIRSFAMFSAKSLATPVLNMANDYLLALNSTNMKKVRQSLDFFYSVANDKGLLSINFWPSFLQFFQNNHPQEIQKMAVIIVKKLASTYETLTMISNVDDLQKYFRPELLDLFLYIVNYCPNVINRQIVNKILQLMENSKYSYKAIVLVCRIVQHSPNPSLSKLILDNLSQNVLKFVDVDGGNLILEILTLYNTSGKLPYNSNEAIHAFGKSKIEINVVAAYRSLFAINGNPELFSLSTILDHVLSPNELIRDSALEFIRRYASGAEGEPLMRLVVTLFEAIFQYQSEKAALLLIRVSTDPRRCVSLLKSGCIEDFLSSEPSTALILLKVFLTIINVDDRCKKYFFQQPLIAEYFTNVAHSGEEEAIISLCWSLTRIKVTEELALSLAESGFISILCEYVSNNKIIDDRLIWCLGAIVRVAPLVDCPEYVNVVRLLIKLINEKSPISHNCIITLASLSMQPSTHMTIIEMNIVAVLSRYKDGGESKAYQSQIMKNLKNSGQFYIP
ncbi:TKL family protein kinase [Tritrichomonas foetus]|uniref:TKL family protein kinase n=1 Tax=Tritrichomonas foetus TaxID=1144522 RepID=A0A1J4JTB9_9EUKA|nr:TKL family protein kinase [Tritrichomonas foetus]|eukprot:OHT02315.1 TKL family protein kinase [Tritrichomonas foetus]